MRRAQSGGHIIRYMCRGQYQQAEACGDRRSTAITIPLCHGDSITVKFNLSEFCWSNSDILQQNTQSTCPKRLTYFRKRQKNLRASVWSTSHMILTAYYASSVTVTDHYDLNVILTSSCQPLAPLGTPPFGSELRSRPDLSRSSRGSSGIWCLHFMSTRDCTRTGLDGPTRTCS